MEPGPHRRRESSVTVAASLITVMDAMKLSTHGAGVTDRSEPGPRLTSVIKAEAQRRSYWTKVSINTLVVCALHSCSYRRPRAALAGGSNA